MTVPTVSTQDMAPVNANNSSTVDKVFSKIANDTIFTPILNTPHLDQNVVVSTLISNASPQTRTVLMKIDISETFTSNLKAVNAAKVEELNNAIKHVYGVDDEGQVPYFLKDLKSKGLALLSLGESPSSQDSNAGDAKLLKCLVRLQMF